MAEKPPVSDASASERIPIGELLASQRRETSGRLVALTRQFDAIVESCALSPCDDEHDPEGSTLGFERAQVAALASQAQLHLHALDRARERLDAGTYGVCERCGGPIETDRLLARVTAQTCIGCASSVARRVGRRINSWGPG